MDLFRRGAYTFVMVGREQPVQLPEAVRSLVEARTGDAVFVVGPDYRIAYWDDQAEELTGLLSEDMVGRYCYDVVLGERESGPFCAQGCSVMHLAQAGRPVSSYDMRISTASGEKRWVNVSILSLKVGKGPYLIHLMRDSQSTHETLEMARGLIQLSKKGEQPASTPPRRDLPALTPRQLEVLKLLASGKSAREIGQDLYLSEATVRNHIRALLQALGAHSQLEALAEARKMGIISG